MTAILIRTIILYLIVIAAMRFSGKRQLAQLQPAEFVIAILMSEVAALPMEDSEVPLLAGIIPIGVLVSMEIFLSALGLKNFKIRKLITGSPVIVINNGKLDQKAMKSLRLTVSDLLDSLRLQGVFDINEVQYAIVETNGELSVLLKNEYRPIETRYVLKKAPEEPVPFSIVCDGIILDNNLKNVNMKESDINKCLKRKNTALKDVILMTADSDGNISVIKKEKNL